MVGWNELIYVADCNNHRIQVFDLNGNYITKYGIHGKNDGNFTYPYGLLFNESGTLFVSEYGHRIQCFT